MMGNIGCLCEACWKGYEKKGMKKMFGKMYPNCVKKESMTEDGHTDVASAKRAMKVIAEDAIDMFKTLKSMNDEGSLPSWWMNKIAISKTYMNSARDYMKNPNESVNEKMGPKQLHTYMQHVFDTQFKTADEKKMKKILIKKMNIAQKKKGLPTFKESVNEISGIQLAKKVVKNKQHEKGMDLFTAQYIVQTHAAYKNNPRLRKQIEKLSVPKAIKLAQYVMGKG